MKPIIGIVMRPEVNQNSRNILGLYKEVSEAIILCGGNVLAIIPPHLEKLNAEEKENLYQIIDLCDGIILEGGDDFYDYDMVICKYVYDKDIPTLGICLGMQIMACLFDGEMLSLKDSFHNQKGISYVHDIHIVSSSLLYKILGKEKVTVNSRHKCYIKKTSLFVSAFYNDIIEAVEDPFKRFFVGVQYHPEDMCTYDTLERCLFENFLAVCRGD